MTSVQWIIEKFDFLNKFEMFDYEEWRNSLILAKEMEKRQIIDAIIYSLDEDGHTGDWKIKFANDYYDKLEKMK